MREVRLPNPAMRASDDDREQLAVELQRHVGAGRLTLAEFSERVAAAYAARTLGELAALRRDLPGSPDPLVARPQWIGGSRAAVVVAGAALLLMFLLLVTLGPMVGWAGAMCH
jgi:hypothetical protein